MRAILYLIAGFSAIALSIQFYNQSIVIGCFNFIRANCSSFFNCSEIEILLAVVL